MKRDGVILKKKKIWKTKGTGVSGEASEGTESKKARETLAGRAIGVCGYTSIPERKALVNEQG